MADVGSADDLARVRAWKKAQKAARAFEKERKTWGRMVEPDRVAELVFEARDGFPTLELEVERIRVLEERSCARVGEELVLDRVVARYAARRHAVPRRGDRNR